MPIANVCVFCGSKDGASPRYGDAAEAFGRALAAQGLDLVYGGAKHGLMGRVATGVLSGGRRAIGVVPKGLSRHEFAHPELTEHHLVDDLAVRKAMMAEKADAFVALPGGFGTMDELFEMLVAAQLGLHHKPIGVLDTDGFYAPLLAWSRHAVAEGFLPASFGDVLVVEREPEPLVRALLTHRPPPSTVKWLGR